MTYLAILIGAAFGKAASLEPLPIAIAVVWFGSTSRRFWTAFWWALIAYALFVLLIYEHRGNAYGGLIATGSALGLCIWIGVVLGVRHLLRVVDRRRNDVDQR